jgi:hypothetical protein
MRELFAAANDCPAAPPARSSVQARALHRACLVVGGVEALAKHLDCTGADLDRWLRGEECPPERAFLAAVEIVLLHAEEPGNSN